MWKKVVVPRKHSRHKVNTNSVCLVQAKSVKGGVIKISHSESSLILLSVVHINASVVRPGKEAQTSLTELPALVIVAEDFANKTYTPPPPLIPDTHPPKISLLSAEKVTEKTQKL